MKHINKENHANKPRRLAFEGKIKEIINRPKIDMEQFLKKKIFNRPTK